MMSVKVFLFASAIVAVLAAPKPDTPGYGQPSKEPGMPFDFQYAVKDEYSGNDFAHDETSDGEVTSGSYRVLLPDGRTQIVTFEADHHNGYNAQVNYEGEPRPYAPPQPAYQ